MKDVEQLDYLKIRSSYKQLLTKFKTVELRYQSAASDISIGGGLQLSSNAFNAVREANLALIQQQILDLLSYFASFMHKVNELCLNQILKVVNSDHVEMTVPKLYMHFKLGIAV